MVSGSGASIQSGMSNASSKDSMAKANREASLKDDLVVERVRCANLMQELSRANEKLKAAGVGMEGIELGSSESSDLSDCESSMDTEGRNSDGDISNSGEGAREAIETDEKRPASLRGGGRDTWWATLGLNSDDSDHFDATGLLHMRG